MRFIAFFAAFASLSLGVGCAAFAPPLTPPEAGGAEWTELTSAHVVLLTDLAGDDATAALEDLERTYVALGKLALPPSEDGALPRPRAPEDDHILVVHFARARDYARFGPEGTVAVFTVALPNDLDPLPTLTLSGDSIASVRRSITHELAHLFLHRSLGATPVWLDEGLAEYYATLTFEDGAVTVGGPTLDLRPAPVGGPMHFVREGPHEVLFVPAQLVPTAAELVRVERSAFYAARGDGPATAEAETRQMGFYVGACALVRTLLDEPALRPRFDRFLRALGRGDKGKAAWDGAFGDADPIALERAFRARLITPLDATVHTIPYAPAAIAAAQRRVLSAAEVHVLWARLRDFAEPAARRAARADLDAALRLAPDLPGAHLYKSLLLSAEGDAAGAERELAAALAVRPHDPVLLMAALRLPRPGLAAGAGAPAVGGTLAGAADRLAGVARSARALQTAANSFGTVGRTEEALGLAARSLRADPSCAVCFATYADLLYVGDRVEEAAAAMRAAIALVPDGVAVPAYEEARAKYEAAAAARR